MLKHLDVARPRSVIAWAVACGLVAGLLAAVYASVIGEPLVDRAIAIEEATATEAQDDVGHPAGEEHADDSIEVSRPTQRGAGLFSAFAILGAACGLLLAATSLSLRGSWLDPFRRIVIAGGILATAITVVPWFKYPPNPPAVGDPSTAGERQTYYFLLIALSCVVLAAAANLSARLRTADWPGYRRLVAVGTTAVVGLALLVALLPANKDPIPSAVPAKLIWQFRVASLGGTTIMWSLLTIGFGLLCAESVRARAAARVKAGEAADQNSIPFIAEIPFS